ncbi:CueP family metal-binding protein [Arthrobacter sulfonylureivorans]|uniref:CueP family metal-binding protein n=1 Tax=Arthrobacter sulfonylureivorans TaxID=2486855 RepID=UPI0039E32C15
MKRPALAAVSLSLLLTACAPAGTESASEGTATDSGLLAEHQLDGLDAAGIIDHLDRLDVAERPADLMASVRQDELLLSDGAQELAMALPEDRSYISIAPYLSQTHDCFFHSLTTCLGELGNKSISVKITDGVTGETLVKEQTETFSNGFAGYWIPDNVQGTIEVSYAGHSGSADFSTSDDGATCITDLRLT